MVKEIDWEDFTLEISEDFASDALGVYYYDSSISFTKEEGFGGSSNPKVIFRVEFTMKNRFESYKGYTLGKVSSEDEYYSLVINFKEAVFGVEKEIEVTRLESCRTCDGSGEKPGPKPYKCITCGGQGQVVSSARTPLGVFQQVMTSS
ncbi:hypothetical protein Patl1_35198 [Pistacia atlantica]|uniref:Uncharacterized protein n=1 Tax=Pistacia atlantica TaxID=434234 RepID=A0ACC0ZWV8_9ROSI|nr:hypothetical protein Patl1_35198 [Pistacia atlantica]